MSGMVEDVTVRISGAAGAGVVVVVLVVASCVVACSVLLLLFFGGVVETSARVRFVCMTPSYLLYFITTRLGGVAGTTIF